MVSNMFAKIWSCAVGRYKRLRSAVFKNRRNNHLYDKVLKHGSTAMTDEELLTVIMDGRWSEDDNSFNAEQLLRDFGSLRSLLAAPVDQLANHPNLNMRRIARLKAMPELVGRQLLEDMKQGPILSTHSAIRRYVRLRLRDNKREIFMCIFLDARDRVIGTEDLFVGSLSGAHVYLREVLLACLRHHAVSVVLVHNHPSGKPEPGSSDERVTRRLKSALRLVGISVADHLVVGENEVASFQERGLI